jgi:hypothetical protein
MMLEAQMHKSLVCAAFAVTFFGLSLSAAPSAMQRPDRASIEPLAQPVVCVGDRRNYRDFNHCWRVNARSQPNNRRYIVTYCSRICPNYGGK